MKLIYPILFSLLLNSVVAGPQQTPGPKPRVQQIYNGYSLPDNSFPWVAYIQTEGIGNCTGSLIAEKVVLTAAHCVFSETSNSFAEPSQVKVILNSNNLLDENSGEKHRVEQIIPHYMYTLGSYDNDLALVILKESSSLPPVKLIRPSSSADEPNPEFMAKAMGYGLTELAKSSNTLRATDLEIKHFTECRTKGFPELNLQNYICTVGWNTNIDSGDSGGPLIVYEEGGWLLAGITSMGSNNFTSEYKKYATFTQLKKFYPWIFMSLIMYDSSSLGYVKQEESDNDIKSAYLLGQLSVIQSPDQYNLVEKSEFETVKIQAIQEIISKPEQYLLYGKNELSAAKQTAQKEVIENPSQFGITTIENPQALIHEGIFKVINNPEEYGLIKPLALGPVLSENEKSWKQIGIRKPIQNLAMFNRDNIEVVWSYQKGKWKYYSNDPERVEVLSEKFEQFTEIPGDSGIWIKFRKQLKN